MPAIILKSLQRIKPVIGKYTIHIKNYIINYFEHLLPVVEEKPTDVKLSSTAAMAAMVRFL